MNSILPIVSLTGKKERVRIVPDFPRYVRDVTHYGAAGAAIRKMVRLPSGDQMRIIVRSFPHAAELLRKDFVRGVLLLIEMELCEDKINPPGIALAHQITDITACFGNGRLFEEYYAFSERHRLKSGIVTYNPDISLPIIEKKNIPFDYIIIGTHRIHTTGKHFLHRNIYVFR